MKAFREFMDELVHADSITQVLMENRKETVKLAAIAVVALMIVLMYLHQSSSELTVTGYDGDSGIRSAESDPAGEAGIGTEEAGAASQASGNSVPGVMPTDTDGIVYVDVGGAVKHPMLAELPAGSRVDDAIEAAGGLKKEADLSTVNRAQLLTDGEKIYIPAKGEDASEAGINAGGNGSGGEETPPEGNAPAAAGISGGRININTADVTLLQQLTGVGPVTAQKIVDYRTQNGQFSSVEELMNISGIGEKTFEKMKDSVTVS